MTWFADIIDVDAFIFDSVTVKLDDEFVNVHDGVDWIVEDGCNCGHDEKDIVFGNVRVIIADVANGSVKVKDMV